MSLVDYSALRKPTMTVGRMVTPTSIPSVGNHRVVLRVGDGQDLTLGPSPALTS